MTIGEAWRITNRELWTERAVCRDHNPDVFFPPPHSHGLEAKAICRTCPVRDECLECLAYALRLKIPVGVYGALTESERRRLTRTPAVVGPECGTERGAARHYRRQERLCEPCAEAVRQRSRNARAVRGAGEGLKVVQGGVQARESGSHGGRADA